MIFDFNQKDFLFDAQEQNCKWVEIVHLVLSAFFPNFDEGRAFTSTWKTSEELFFVKEQAPPCSKDCRTIDDWKSDIIMRRLF